MVSSFLNCDATAAESWIVNFIRLSNIEAKIDSENGIVSIMKKQNAFDDIVIQTILSLESNFFLFSDFEQVKRYCAQNRFVGEQLKESDFHLNSYGPSPPPILLRVFPFNQ